MPRPSATTACCASRPPRSERSGQPSWQLVLVLGEIAPDHVERELAQDRRRGLALEQELEGRAHDALEVLVAEACGYGDAVVARAVDRDVIVATGQRRDAD